MSGPLQVELSYHRRVSGAAQRSGVPLVELLALHNRSRAALSDLVVELWAEPDLGERYLARIAHIGAGETYSLRRVALPFPAERLVNLTELEEGRLGLTVRSGDNVLHRETHPISLLAYNEWPGLGALPELLAAYVLPNHPDVQQVLASARDHLERWTSDPTLSGYDARDPVRVRQVAAAVYAAVQSLGVTYVRPPASFEAQGQKVRTPELVLSTRMGTSLDLALLAAAALEQAGLRPVLLLGRAHAAAACWLVAEQLPSPATDDPARLRRAARQGELSAFDPTEATRRPPVSYEDAEARATALLGPGGGFEWAVDVEAARRAAIRPLPSRTRDASFAVAEGPGGAADAISATAPAPVEHLGPVASAAAEAADAPAGPRRLQRWKTALLDLSLRNRLLNFKETKRSVGLLLPQVGSLEDALAAGRELTIYARPWLVRGEGADPAMSPRPDLPDPEDDEALKSYLESELAAGRLYADLREAELEKRLLNISRGARSAQLEGGTSTLFLALGMLGWTEAKTPDVVRRAPVLLLPLELLRERAGARFRLRLAEDEARLNPTLLQLLETEYGITLPELDTLPTDASGLNVPLILGELRHAVAEQPGWEVADEAVVALLSFTKFLMYNDLEQHAPRLMDNPVVRHLVAEGDGDTPPWADAAFPDPATLDETHPPAETFCPLNADGSQLSAVFAAADGLSFVLEGPPGTGKSQTITNLIAHSLTQGRTVLFVSEKLAALQVVQSRLARVGLAPFCLELHSRKARKREVLEQLAQALEAANCPEPEAWARQADGLAELRTDLNDYASRLHGPTPLGLTVFEVTGRLLDLGPTPRVNLSAEPPVETTASQLDTLRDAVQRVATAAAPLGLLAEHPWQGVRRGQWEPGLEAEVERALDPLQPAVEVVRQAADEVRKRLGLPDVGRDRQGLQSLVTLAERLAEAPAPTAALLEPSGWADRRARVEDWIAHGRERRRRWTPLADTYTPALLALPLAQLAARFSRWAGAFFLLAWIMLWRARSALSRVSLQGRIPPSREVGAQLSDAQRVNAEDVHLTNAEAEARTLFGHRWQGADSDWDDLQSLTDWCGDVRAALATLTARLDEPEAAQARKRVLNVACETPERAAADQPLGVALRALVDAWQALEARRKDLVALLTLVPHRAVAPPDHPDALQWLEAQVTTWRTALPALRSWCLYRSAVHEADALGLTPLLEALDRGEVDSEGLADCFERSWLAAWLDAVTRREPALRTFHGAEHDRRVDRFRDLDGRLLQLVQAESRARLAERVPDPALGAVAGSELALVLREIQKKRRHLPVRQLFQRIPRLLPKLKPCVLMSPLSVAQYLDPELEPFDLVVFDEASQIPVWDAIGAIARGAQVVVVGDSRQLPPTSFFQRTEGDDHGEDDFEELESILDECVAAGLPRRRLQWHYRSRHEHLIAFSNHHYYDGDLYTFPAALAASGRLGLRHVAVEGVYDKGKTRTNRAEAEAVVAEILRRLQDPTDRERSIGVVTFNQPQQTLIENLLEDARRAHPDLEPHFADERDEPVFVKNLENVQGDERDVMLFSVCYAPDAQGRLSMHFGPLNRAGGERRLNVAVTRAREQLVVFATLRAEQMDLTRTQALGVHHLHAFLRYANQGPAALSETLTSGGESADAPPDPLVDDLRSQLAERGWTLDTRVGCSAARVDLGVRDPERAGHYLLGVEGDGLVYREGQTARDRDGLRPAVLGQLGWRLHRVWSMEWYRSRAAELERLDRALENAREDARRQDSPEPSAGAPVPAPAPPPPDTATQRVAAVVSQAEQQALPGEQPYAVADLGPQGSPEDFDKPNAKSRIRELARRLVEVEGPISEDRLTHRIAECWALSRVTRRVRDRILAEFPAGVQRVDGFLWPADLSPDRYDTIRRPTDDPQSDRPAEDIPVEELANALAAVLQQNTELPRDALYSSTAKVFGIARVGNRVRTQLDRALQRLVDRGQARLKGDRVAWRAD